MGFGFLSFDGGKRCAFWGVIAVKAHSLEPPLFV